MKSISLLEPWASLVAYGFKKIETRSWSTPFRGPLAIHASKEMPRWAEDLCTDEPFFEVLREIVGPEMLRRRPRDWFPYRGHVLATARLVKISPTSTAVDWDKLPPYERAFGDYGPDRFMWLLADVARLERPVPATGHLSLWDWDGAPS